MAYVCPCWPLYVPYVHKHTSRGKVAGHLAVRRFKPTGASIIVSRTSISGLTENHIQISPTPATIPVIYTKHGTIGSLVNLFPGFGSKVVADGIERNFSFDLGLNFINTFYFGHIVNICDLVCGVLFEFGHSVLGYTLVLHRL